MTPADSADENPLAEGLERRPVHPTVLVIFGGTGDLAYRKLLPAVANLAHDGALPERFALIGIGRSEFADESYRAQLAGSIAEHSRRTPDADVLTKLLEEVRYVRGSFDDDATYEQVTAMLGEVDAAAGRPLNRCFYLSTAPGFFDVITERLGAHGLAAHAAAETRIVIEKPFGTDLQEARELNRCVLAVFSEQQVFRIDHYLGKETVQNVMAFRFANLMFEPLWNRNYIDHVQITASEEIGIGSRAGYYDGSGALRDLVENHMMQLLTLLCMEPPVAFDADAVRDEKVKVLRAIRPPAVEQAVRAQYAPGTVAGEPTPGYTEEDGVPDDSHTETYAALRLTVDNWRWAGVPMVLRTGKRLARKVTEIAVTLKPVPHQTFSGEEARGARPNTLVLTVQPSEGVSLSLGAKIPGVGGASSGMRIRPVNMEFLYGTSFLSQSPEAYERLLLDAMRGDATLFTRNDEVEAQWRICDPIVQAWSQAPADGGPALHAYAAGSQGPAEAARLLAGERRWRAI